MASPLSAADVESIMTTFGAPGTYTPPNGGTPVPSISAEVDRGAANRTTDAGAVVEAVDVLIFKRSDYDPPAHNARWTDGTSTWVLGDVVDRDESFVRVEGRLV